MCIYNPLIRLNRNFFNTQFGYFLTTLGVSRRFQLGIYIYIYIYIYTLVHEESESEVQNTQILQENLICLISFVF